jgi:hypothetical protein
MDRRHFGAGSTYSPYLSQIAFTRRAGLVNG